MSSPLNRRAVPAALDVLAAAVLTPVLAPGVAHAAPTCTGTSLRDRYHQVIGVDGQFGTQTRNAVRAAQRRINQLHGGA